MIEKESMLGKLIQITVREDILPRGVQKDSIGIIIAQSVKNDLFSVLISGRLILLWYPDECRAVE